MHKMISSPRAIHSRRDLHSAILVQSDCYTLHRQYILLNPVVPKDVTTTMSRVARQSAQALLNTLSVAKAIQTRASQLFRLPDVAQAVQIRIRRLRKLPHVVRAIQAHIEQVSKIPQVARAMQASIERLSKISPLIRVTRRSSIVPTSTATASRPDLRSTWCCFICIAMSGRENVAMKIPCPPSKSGTADRETKIYEIINERLTIYYGMSRFLPFYGVQRVEEVNVRATQSHMLDLCTDIYRSSNSSALPPIRTDLFRSSFVP
jgi:hypothetical protein